MEMDYKYLKYVSYVSGAHNDTQIQGEYRSGAMCIGTLADTAWIS